MVTLHMLCRPGGWKCTSSLQPASLHPGKVTKEISQKVCSIYSYSLRNIKKKPMSMGLVSVKANEPAWGQALPIEILNRLLVSGVF